MNDVSCAPNDSRSPQVLLTTSGHCCGNRNRSIFCPFDVFCPIDCGHLFATHRILLWISWFFFSSSILPAVDGAVGSFPFQATDASFITFTNRRTHQMTRDWFLPLKLVRMRSRHERGRRTKSQKPGSSTKKEEKKKQTKSTQTKYGSARKLTEMIASNVKTSNGCVNSMYSPRCLSPLFSISIEIRVRFFFRARTLIDWIKLKQINVWGYDSRMRRVLHWTY